VVKAKLFDILAERGHKQRWLLEQLRERGYRFSETYLSQVKSGLKAPSRRFIEAVSATLGLPEHELFETDGGAPRRAARPAKTGRARTKGPINVAIIGVGNCASSLVQGVHFYRGADEATGYRTKSMIAVPLKVGDRITGVAQVINRLDEKPFDADDLELFIALCGMAAIAIENGKMHQSLMEKQRLVKDMEFARTVQESFLPQKVPAVPGYAFSAHYTPAQEVGGDFYDFIHLDRDRIGIVIGDVSGKGVPAALYMAKLGSDLRTLALTEDDPEQALQKLNDLLAERSRRGMFATLLYIELDAQNGALTLSNAGHLPLIIKKADGSVERRAPAAGAPLGILPGMKFGQESLSLERGDTVLLYTDGIVEAMNAGEELYGYERFDALIRKSPSAPDGLTSAIIDGVNKFTGLTPQHDDMTLVCFGALQ